MPDNGYFAHYQALIFVFYLSNIQKYQSGVTDLV